MEEPRGDKSGPFVIFPRHRVASFRVPLAVDATLLYHSGDRARAFYAVLRCFCHRRYIDRPLSFVISPEFGFVDVKLKARILM